MQILIGAHHLHYSAKLIRVNGVTYKPPCAVTLLMNEDTPVFGKVQMVLVCESKLFLHTRVLATCQFDKHYHAFFVQTSGECKTVAIEELYSPTPLHIRRLLIGGHAHQVIVPKHHIINVIV